MTVKNAGDSDLIICVYKAIIIWEIPLTYLHFYGGGGLLITCASARELFYKPIHIRELYNKHANHMTMTTSGQIMPWSDCLNTKGNVKIKL